MRRLALLGAATAALVTVAVATPAAAITRGGQLDGDDHPYVGLMVATDADGAPLWRCSGALVSPTVYVTAGHCTFGADGALIWFESDLEDPSPAAYGYPDNVVRDADGDVVADDPATPEDERVGTAHAGTPFAHGAYDDSAFWAHDLGVVVLDEPVDMDEFATIAPLGYVDTMTKGRKKDTSKVTAVGYGLQEIVEGPAGVGPDFDPKLRADRTRWQADLMIVNTQGVAGLGPISPDQSFAMSGDAKHGGTCFGDSGGPILAYGTDVIVGVNSFGLNSNCAGIGGAYRVDQPDDHDFLDDFVALD